MKIIKVVMSETVKGSPDGLKVREYEQGKEYDLPESLATVFVSEMDVAEVVKEPEAELSEAEKAKAEAEAKAEAKTAAKK